MPIPIIYRKAGEPQFVSLTLKNAATGVGYITFFGAGFLDASDGTNVTKYALLPSTFPAGDISSSQNGGINVNFDLEILKPLTVEGEAFVTYTTSSPPAVGGRSSVIIQKISNSITTDLKSGSGAIVSGSTARRNVVALKLPKTRFRKNDTFRLKIEIGNAPGEASVLYHDPKTRTKTSENEADTGAPEDTDLIIDIPIKVAI